MKDSGERQSFASGSFRDTDEGKPRIDLISPFSNRRVGAWLERGARKYELRNWEKGQPISRCLASLHRHLASYQARDGDEDHAAAIATNIMFILHYEAMIERGVLPKELDDRPCYDAPIEAAARSARGCEKYIGPGIGPRLFTPDETCDDISSLPT